MTSSILDPNPPGYLVVALYHEDSVALNQQDGPFHVPQPFTDDVHLGVN